MADQVLSGRRVRRFLAMLARHAKSSANRPERAKSNAFLQDKLGRIESGISQLIETQRQEYSQLRDMDEKIITDVQGARDDMAALEKDIQAIEERFKGLKDVPEDQLNSLKRRITRMKSTVESMGP